MDDVPEQPVEIESAIPTESKVELGNDLYELCDGFSYTYAYPKHIDTLEGPAIYYTYKLAKAIDSDTNQVTAHLLVITASLDDPRREGFTPTPGDKITMLPMTESALYGLMSVLITLRSDMMPDTSAMLQTMFEPGHFKRN